jgi:hypothetical protein
MAETGGKIALLVPAIVLMTVVVASFPARSDIAPYHVQGGGAAGILCNRTDMKMRSFSVDVSVNLPNVHEVFVYLLDNPTDRAVEQIVIIPITFEANHSRSFTLKSAEISVNGQKTGYVQGSIALEPDLVVDSPEIIGLYANVTFPPRSTTNITLDMSRSFASYTRSFVYVYSAKTARYWNGTIEHGHFGLTYLSQLEEMSYSMPNGTQKGRAVASEMYDWDGNATYEVTVGTGVIYRHAYPFPSVQLILLLAVGLPVILAAVLAVASAKRRKEAARRSFYAPRQPARYPPRQPPS